MVFLMGDMVMFAWIELPWSTHHYSPTKQHLLIGLPWECVPPLLVLSLPTPVASCLNPQHNPHRRQLYCSLFITSGVLTDRHEVCVEQLILCVCVVRGVVCILVCIVQCTVVESVGLKF